jgi:hypothetical protein
MFRQVKLVTRDGNHVATVVVPAFEVAPEMLHWGSRFFVRHGRHVRLEDEDVYHCVAVMPIPGLARNDGTDNIPPGLVRRRVPGEPD